MAIPLPRFLIAEDDGRLVVTQTHSFSPKEFRADPAALSFLSSRIVALNERVLAGLSPAAEDQTLFEMLTDSDTPIADVAPGCGGGCSCSALTPTKRVELFLLLAQFCNLGCVYCFDGTETYQIKRRLRMTEETAIAAADRIIDMLGAGDTLTVTFFGGEPLLNWRTAEKVIKHVKQRCLVKLIALHFAVQTNLTFLPSNFVEIAKRENMIVMCSLDGDEEIHNSLRPHQDKAANSYRMTIEKLAVLREAGVPFILRSTLTSANARRLCDVADHHKSLGAAGIVFGLLRPINSDGIVFANSLAPSREDLSYSFARLYHEHPEIVAETVQGMISQMHAENETYSCGAASMGTPAVDSNGDVYSCVFFVGRPDRVIGNVHAAGFLDPGAITRNTDAFDNAADPVCKTCDYFTVCRGGCSATRIISEDSGAGTDARMLQRNQQCALIKGLMREVLLAHSSDYTLG